MNRLRKRKRPPRQRAAHRKAQQSSYSSSQYNRLSERVFAQACLTREEVNAAGHPLNAVLLDKIFEADRRWFKNHPDHRFRMRKGMNGEPSGCLVIVEQIEDNHLFWNLLWQAGQVPTINDDDTLRSLMKRTWSGETLLIHVNGTITSLEEFEGVLQ